MGKNKVLVKVSSFSVLISFWSTTLDQFFLLCSFYCYLSIYHCHLLELTSLIFVIHCCNYICLSLV
jgi:hypothetical protein